MTTILDDIFEVKRRRLDELKRRTDIDRLVTSAREIRASSEPHRFRQALERPDRINVIAEFKKASPSRGVINDSALPADVARQYEQSGACAISVLTEEDFFQGSLDHLREIRAAVSLPVLRKDFLFDEFQIYEAAAAGADAILLITASLDADTLKRLRLIAEDLGMDALVEVHTVDEMHVAASIGASLIGVNNRDLRTFKVSLEVSRDLARHAPPGTTLVAESGLRSRADLVELRSLGYAGFLIGETLMRSDDVGNELSALTDISSL